MTDIKETSGRIMAIDFGDVRTGLAISDETRFLASGIGYVKVGGIVKTADKVAQGETYLNIMTANLEVLKQALN